MRYWYSGKLNYEVDRDKRPKYCCFMVSEVGKPVDEYFTDRDFSGLFVRDYDRGIYVQYEGTSDFCLGNNWDTARRKLRKLYHRYDDPQSDRA